MIAAPSLATDPFDEAFLAAPRDAHTGRRLGQMVARLEAEVVLAALIPRVKSIRLTGPPERRINNTLHALAGLPVGIEPA